MKPDTIIKKYEMCKSAEQKYKFVEDLREALGQCEEFNREHISYCPHCNKHIYDNDIIERFETWTQFMMVGGDGYLDDYKYEHREMKGYRKYCPICKEIMR